MRRVMLVLVCLLGQPASAQASTQQDEQLPASLPLDPRPTTVDDVADSTIGQRRAGDQAGRIDIRIQNRVQSRIRNRLDRNYNPQANSTSPFAVADDEARTPIKPYSR